MKKRPLIALAMACALLLSACSASGSAGTDGKTADTKSTTAETSASTKTTSTTTEPGETNASGASSADAYHKITSEEAKQMMDAGNVTIVDVRTEDEYNQGHVPDAILIPLQTIGDEMPEQLPEKDASLIVYCRSGVRSKQASDKLVALGYTSIYDMGGIIDWTYETELPEE